MSRRKHLQRMLETAYEADERRQRERSFLTEARKKGAPAIGKDANEPALRTVFVPTGAQLTDSSSGTVEVFSKSGVCREGIV